MRAQGLITGALARLFRSAQTARAVRARRLRRAFSAAGLADAQQVRELQSKVDLMLGRAAALHREMREERGE